MAVTGQRTAHERGIAWAPGPVVSAGGIVAAAAREIDGLAAPDV